LTVTGTGSEPGFGHLTNGLSILREVRKKEKLEREMRELRLSVENSQMGVENEGDSVEPKSGVCHRASKGFARTEERCRKTN
jgi:hypothetical protein